MCVLVWFCVENANGLNVQEAMMWFEMAASLVCSVLRVMELSVERLITFAAFGGGIQQGMYYFLHKYVACSSGTFCGPVSPKFCMLPPPLLNALVLVLTFSEPLLELYGSCVCGT